MNDAEKTKQLQSLIDELCDLEFAKNENKISACIQTLEKIYANKYRHTYSDIFFKIQEIISRSDSEVLEALGENLNVVRRNIENAISQNSDDENLKITLAGYNKFADHVNLEIGRYNFIKNNFSKNSANDFTPNQQGLDKSLFDESIEAIKDDINKIRPIATQAQRELDKLDERLENNKISSITALTIFSAVVLAFSGGISFEIGMLQSMASASSYRLVFVIALTGFVLFNTIFALLYLVGKLSGKSIETKCKYNDFEANDTNKCKCGKGICSKSFSTGSLWCRLKNKYSYVLFVDAILLLTMYADFFLWYFNGNIYDIRFILSQLIILLVFLLAIGLKYIRRGIQHKRTILAIKVDILRRIVAPQEKTPNIFSTISTMLSNIMLKPQTDIIGEFIISIENVEYKELLRKINKFSEEYFLSKRDVFPTINLMENKLNKIKWKKYKKRIQQSEN